MRLNDQLIEAFDKKKTLIDVQISGSGMVYMGPLNALPERYLYSELSSISATDIEETESPYDVVLIVVLKKKGESK